MRMRWPIANTRSGAAMTGVAARAVNVETAARTAANVPPAMPRPRRTRTGTTCMPGACPLARVAVKGRNRLARLAEDRPLGGLGRLVDEAANLFLGGLDDVDDVLFEE